MDTDVGLPGKKIDTDMEIRILKILKKIDTDLEIRILKILKKIVTDLEIRILGGIFCILDQNGAFFRGFSALF